jgi:hypothetical protein
MDQIPLERFKKLTSEQIAQGPCFEVTVYGAPAFVVVVKPQMGMRDTILGYCSIINQGRGNPAMADTVLPLEEADPGQAPTLEPTGASVEVVA